MKSPPSLSKENVAVSVMTNMIIKAMYYQGKCLEYQEYQEAHCKENADCIEGTEVVFYEVKYMK